MNQLLDHALTYAARGWHVFPLHPESKRPACPDHRVTDCTGSDPWCRNGHTGWQDRATTDPDRIVRGWSSTGYGIGIACGPSQLVVVDLDTAKDDEPAPESGADEGARCGGDVLALLANQHHGTVPASYTVRTVSGGTHLYFTTGIGPDTGSNAGAAPYVSNPYGNTAGSLGWLIDTRAAGGYVVAPPTTITAGAYTVVDDRPPARLPDWLADLLTNRNRQDRQPRRRVVQLDRLDAYVAAAVTAEARKVTAALPGTRNHTLFCAAVALGQLVAGGQLPEADAYAALLDAAAGRVAAGAFTAAEAEATIRSGLRTGARNPRTAA